MDEYKGMKKPKHWLAVNFPVDIKKTGPLVRTWCMTFEALLQVLKGCACHSNYKDIIFRMARMWSVRSAMDLTNQCVGRWSETLVTLIHGEFEYLHLANGTVLSCQEHESDSVTPFVVKVWHITLC